MGNFKKCLKDIIQLFLSVTIKLEEERITTEVTE